MEFRVADGVSSRDFRIICECQQHRASRREWHRYGRIVRTQGFAMVIAVSFGVAFIEAPTGAALLREKPVTSKSSWPETTIAPRTVDKLQQTVREALFAPSTRVEPKLISERVREEFFRSEIPFGALIYREAKRNNLSPELVAAVIKAESDFRPSLRSNRNALGLMQIIPSTGALMGASDLLDPADNIRAGTRYLRYLHRRFNGDQTTILAAYNAGEGNIARFGGIPPFRETHEYLRRVTRNNAEYSRRLRQRLVAARLGLPVEREFAPASRTKKRSAVLLASAATSDASALSSVAVLSLQPAQSSAAISESGQSEAVALPTPNEAQATQDPIGETVTAAAPLTDVPDPLQLGVTPDPLDHH